MRLVDWNIQWGRGVDGRVDLARIVAEAKALHDFDVLCLQEVTRGFHESEQAGGLKGGPGADQFAELEALIPGATVIDGIGSDLPPVGAGIARRAPRWCGPGRPPPWLRVLGSGRPALG